MIRPETSDQRINLVEHKSFSFVLKCCKELDNSPAGTVAFVVGPSGAGKTELSYLIGPQIYGGGREESGKQLWVRVSAENPQAGFFTSKYLIGQILEEFRDPFHGMTHSLPEGLPPEQAERLRFALTRIAKGIRASEEDTRKAAISIARALSCRMLILDEANLMVLTKKGRPIEVYLESIRTLAKAMGVRVLMLGTLSLLDYVDYSAQISRIGLIWHLDRMKDDSEEAMLEFLSFLDQVQSDLGLGDLLTGNAEALYEATYGIPGELISLLERARIKAAADGRTDIEFRHVEDSLPLQVIRERMRAEADLIENFVSGKPISLPPGILGLSRRDRGRKARGKE